MRKKSKEDVAPRVLETLVALGVVSPDAPDKGASAIDAVNATRVAVMQGVLLAEFVSDTAEEHSIDEFAPAMPAAWREHAQELLGAGPLGSRIRSFPEGTVSRAVIEQAARWRH